MPDLSAKYAYLNDRQREAVLSGEGPVLLLAGPGSGKTATICARILYLIEEKKISPEHILVITFTKSAALSMQQRFQKLTAQSFTYNLPVNFGTFHACFFHILQKYQNFQTKNLLDDNHKRQLLIPVLRKYLSAEGADMLKEYLTAISFYKNTGDEKGASECLTEKGKESFLDIFREYERERCRARLLDFDDMVYECRNLLRDNGDVRRQLQQRYTHILVDEFQDINPMQYEVLKYLAGKGKHVFAVGDDDQAIYGFRGSSPACLQMFIREFHAKHIELRMNYRSTQEIIRASTRVIEENKERIAKEMQEAVRREKATDVCLKHFEEREQEYQYLIRSLREKGNEECAVLFRTNSYMQGFAARLDREGIAYVMKEKGTGIYDHFIAGDIMAYLQIAAGKGNREMWFRIMNKPYRQLDREIFTSEGVHAISTNARENLQRLKRQLQEISGMRPDLAVRFVLKVMGYEAYLQRKAERDESKWHEWAWICDWLTEEAAAFHTIEEWMRAQKESVQKERSRGKNAMGAEPRLQLMTAHASKGLEFDRVYIPDCNEKNYPHGNMPDEKACEEERRLLYVAMTRAKKNLELLYLTGTRERPRLPSRFLNPLLTRLPAHQTHCCPDIHQRHLPPFHTPRHPQ